MPFNNITLNSLAENVFEHVTTLLRNKGLSDSLSIKAIILYGSAAKYHFGVVEHFNDYDLNIFFTKHRDYNTNDSKRFNKRGGYWRSANFRGKEVQLLFNTLNNNEDVIDYINRMKSNRWTMIKESSIVQIYPVIDKLR